MNQPNNNVEKNYFSAFRSPLAFSFLFLFASSTFALEEGPVSQLLGPTSKPPLNKVGYEWHAIRNGKPYVAKTVAVTDGTYTVEGSNGCSYTSSAPFAPSLEWSKCTGSTGTQEIRKTKGSAWPMQVKNKFSFTYSGRNKKGSSWRDTRRCKVKDQVRVTVPAGEFDTYKVVCVDKWNTRTWWFAPELDGGTTVAFKRKHRSDSSRNLTMELTKTVLP